MFFVYSFYSFPVGIPGEKISNSKVFKRIRSSRCGRRFKLVGNTSEDLVPE